MSQDAPNDPPVDLYKGQEASKDSKINCLGLSK